MPAQTAVDLPLVGTVQAGLPQAHAGALTTFGIVPESPETGYGYLRRGDALDGAVARLDSFVEKPDAATAQIAAVET